MLISLAFVRLAFISSCIIGVNVGTPKFVWTYNCIKNYSHCQYKTDHPTNDVVVCGQITEMGALPATNGTASGQYPVLYGISSVTF